MKTTTFILLICVVFPACNLFDFDRSDDSPDCIGTDESFSLNLLEDGYNGKIWNEDTTINTPFVFADFQFDDYLLRRTYKMYIRIKESDTRTVYPALLCFRHWDTEEWMADGAFNFNGHYTTWDFYFDQFDCYSLAGWCMVIQPESGDTTYFQFDGAR